MNHRHLPLNAIRMFAVVGRLLSYSHAAAELNVTASAVSQQVRILEEYLGASLLRREGNRIALTAVGRDYLRQVTESLGHLSSATKNVLSTAQGRTLRVVATPSIATWWLMPRIDRFLKACPDIFLNLAISENRANSFSSGQVDVAILYGNFFASGLRADRLADSKAIPVCSPALMQGPQPLRSPSDLRHHTLIDSRSDLYLDETNPGWEGWLREAGIPELSSMRRLVFSPTSLMLQAAAQGLGIGLSRTLLAANAIASGQLACPFGPAIPLSASYHVLCLDKAAHDPDITAFREWLIEEARISISGVTVPRAPHAAAYEAPALAGAAGQASQEFSPAALLTGKEKI